MGNDLIKLTRCPGCGTSSEAGTRLFELPLLEQVCPVLRCPACTLVYKAYAPTPSGLAKIYSDQYTHFRTGQEGLGLQETLSAKQKLSRCRRLLQTGSRRDEVRLLDIGCGSGNFVTIARGMGFQAEGIDTYLPNPLQSGHLRKASPSDVPRQSFDIALLLNVAEHLVDPIAMFSAVRNLLKPGGVMLLSCPYGDSWARKFHRNAWGHIVLDEHLLFWTPASLRYVLRNLGFKGKESYRIAGAPFPFGRTTPRSCEPRAAAPPPPPPSPSPAPRARAGLQATAWAAARSIQRHEFAANALRSLIHVLGAGDYLEYAIAKGQPA